MCTFTIDIIILLSLQLYEFIGITTCNHRSSTMVGAVFLDSLLGVRRDITTVPFQIHVLYPFIGSPIT